LKEKLREYWRRIITGEQLVRRMRKEEKNNKMKLAIGPK
jgi:hypothetical protein